MGQKTIQIGDHIIGDNYPIYIIAEIGNNHNGSLETAKELIDSAVSSDCDAVKFQKRTPEICVPLDQQSRMRDTPWGYISYLDYRRKTEFGKDEYQEIDRYCKEVGIGWFASPWDEPSVDFLEQFDPVCHKVPSASLTDHGLLKHLRATGRPLILSTGMSRLDQIEKAVDVIGMDDLIITHATSAYPCEPQELNLKMIESLKKKYPVPIGYSGHEVGLITSVIAVALGACLVERHITLDRAMWGSDQAASVEPGGLRRLVKYIRVAELSLGDGVKKVYDSELSQIDKLRRVSDD